MRVVNGFNIAPLANLRGADLRGANLSDADLSGANLRGADLRGADLSGANLRHANLRGAKLRGADLRHTNLRDARLNDANLSDADLSGAKNFYLLPAQDPRGYSFIHAVKSDRGWLIVSGCRRLTIGAATLHWGANYEGDRETGDMYLAAINWLIAEVSSFDGWLGDGNDD